MSHLTPGFYVFVEKAVAGKRLRRSVFMRKRSREQLTISSPWKFHFFQNFKILSPCFSTTNGEINECSWLFWSSFSCGCGLEKSKHCFFKIENQFAIFWGEITFVVFERFSISVFNNWLFYFSLGCTSSTLSWTDSNPTKNEHRSDPSTLISMP